MRSKKSAMRAVGRIGGDSVYVTKDGTVLKNEQEIQPRKCGARRSVRLERNGKVCWVELGRLILEAFVGPFKTGCSCAYVVDYRNGDKTDNRLANLRWRRKALRLDDPLRTKWYHHGVKNGNAKYSDAVVRRALDLRMTGMHADKIAAVLGASAQWVSKVIHGTIRCDVVPSDAFKSRVEFLMGQTTVTITGNVVTLGDQKSVWLTYKQVGRILNVSALVVARAVEGIQPSNWRHPKYWAGKAKHVTKREVDRPPWIKDRVAAQAGDRPASALSFKDLPGMNIPQRPALEDTHDDKCKWFQMDSPGKTFSDLPA